MTDDIDADVEVDEILPDKPFGSISFANLDETDFEEFCFPEHTRL